MTVSRARQVLGAAAGADAAALAQAYRRAVKTAHPDRGGDAERLREVVDAHRLLKRIAESPLVMTPAVRAAAPRTLRMPITVAEALLGGERRLDVGDGRVVVLRLPPGLRHGEMLAGLKAGQAGDAPVRLSVAVVAEAGLTVRGHDLCIEQEAPAGSLRAGERLQIDTPRGPAPWVCPEGMQDGGVVRIRGEGLPARGRHPAGDLILTLVRAASLAEDADARARLRRFAARWAA
ncbi:MAG: DnaJ C-terminal domain-containing protein [Caulobacteraceae bacterium]